MADINIKIKIPNSPIKTVTVKSDSKVEDIMKEIEKFSNIPPKEQKLIFKGKNLKQEDPISKYKIENNITLIMVKKGKTENAKPPSSSTTQSSLSQSNTNNDSSNRDDNITIKIKTNYISSTMSHFKQFIAYYFKIDNITFPNVWIL